MLGTAESAHRDHTATGCTFAGHLCRPSLDPEQHIRTNGYQSVRTGDDGKTRFYSFTEHARSSRIAILEAEIARLPKQAEILQACNILRGGITATLIQERHIAVDVAVTNYGYSGSTVACVLKYMHQNEVSTQLVYYKKAAGGMYTVFVTD
ncbi:MAG: hypothetical protein KGI87_12910 [Burkholderiales bacterium]|nr:hypothetical protein [Burkholderiales bacterium]